MGTTALYQNSGSPLTDRGVEFAEKPLQTVWGDYVACFSQWASFLTLTYDQSDRTHEVTRTEALYNWRLLVQVLNRDLFGERYTRIVHHSYFGYALGFERKPWGLLHMHAVVDRRVNFAKIHDWWGYRFGFALIEKSTDERARYVAKYATKGGDILLYKPSKHKEPAFLPLWYSGLQG